MPFTQCLDCNKCKSGGESRISGVIDLHLRAFVHWPFISSFFSIQTSLCFPRDISEWTFSLFFPAFWSATSWQKNTKNTGSWHFPNFMPAECAAYFPQWEQWFCQFLSFMCSYRTLPNESSLFRRQDQPFCILLTGISSLNLQIISRQKQKPTHLDISGPLQLKSSFTFSFQFS